MNQKLLILVYKKFMKRLLFFIALVINFGWCVGENIVMVGIVVMFITYSVKKENDINKFNSVLNNV